MADALFKDQQPSLTSPIRTTFDITPGVAEFSQHPRAIYVGVSGDVVIVDLDDEERFLKGLVAGIWHPVRCKKILATATALGSPAPTTTATYIVGGY